MHIHQERKPLLYPKQKKEKIMNNCKYQLGAARTIKGFAIDYWEIVGRIFDNVSFCNPIKISNKMVMASGIYFIYLIFFGKSISNLSYNPNPYLKNTEIPCHWQGHEYLAQANCDCSAVLSHCANNLAQVYRLCCLIPSTVLVICRTSLCMQAHH